MIQGAESAGLLFETLPARGIGGHFGGKHLDGDGPVQAGIAGSPDDEVRDASALLTAFLLTDRLPYAMLAEELIQHTRRNLLKAGDLPFAIACEAATVLSRMASLHANEEYRAAAILAPDAHYADDAALILERLADEAAAHGLASAAYGLAAGELQSAFPCQ